MPEIRLFCLPFAGGSAYAYNPFREHLPERIELVPIELPGHGRRMREPLLSTLPEMIEEVLGQLRRHGLDTPYAIYAHSMGGLLSYLLARRILADGLPAPRRLIISGCSAPPLIPKESKKSHLPKPRFVEMLEELGGCPPEILANAELLDLFEPVLRADFKAVESYVYQALPPLDLPFTLLYGDRDAEAGRATISPWQNETTRPIALHEFSGDHFFIFEHLPEIGRIIAEALFRP